MSKKSLLLWLVAGTALLSGCDSFPRVSTALHRIAVRCGLAHDAIYDAQVLDRKGNVLVSFAPYKGENSHRSLENVYHYGDLAFQTIGFYDPTMKINSDFGIVGAHKEELYSGEKVETTLDMTWQAMADSLLREAFPEMEHLRKACLVVQNVWTGAVPVIVNLERTEKGISEGYNYSVDYRYEPGEVMAPASWLAALQDGIAYSGEGLSDAVASGKLAKAYGMVPDHYARTLRSFLLPCDYNYFGVREHEGLTICSPSSADWSPSTPERLVHGRDMFMSPIYVLSFYSSLVSGEITAPYVVRDGISRYFGDLPDDIDMKIIFDTFEQVGGADLTGRSSVSWRYLRNLGNYASETFAGVFPAEAPDYAVVCVLFTDVLSSGNEAVSGVAEKVSARLSEKIMGEDYEPSGERLGDEKFTCFSEDGIVKAVSWDTGTGGTSPNFACEFYLKRPSGKFVRENVKYFSDMFIDSVHCVRKDDGSCYYFAICYGRSSSQEAELALVAFKIEDNGIHIVDILDGKWRPEDERENLYVMYNIREKNAMIEEYGWDWIFHYDASSQELCVPISEGYGLTERYQVLRFDGKRFIDCGERTLLGNPS